MSPSAARAISRHQVRAQEPPDRRALVVGVDEVAAAAVVEVELVDAVAVHLAVALVDEPAALAAQDLEIARGHDAVEDEEPVVREAASVLVVIGAAERPYCSPCWRPTELSASCRACLLVAPRVPIVSCDGRGSGAPAGRRRAGGPSRRRRRAAARPPARRARAQPRGAGHRVVPAGRAALRADAAHADVAVPRSGSRARRRVRRPRAVVGGVPPRARVPRRDGDAGTAAARARSGRPVLAPPRRAASRAPRRAPARAARRRDGRRRAPERRARLPAALRVAGVSRQRGRRRGRRRPPRGRDRRPLPARRPRGGRPRRARANGRAEPVASEPHLQSPDRRLDHAVSQPAPTRALHRPLRPRPPHHRTRRRARGRLRQLRPVLPRVPRGDRTHPNDAAPLRRRTHR